MAENWSREEVEATVADYFSMLEKELRREPYNKAEHNRRLQRILNGRSHGSVERKHQNISAILRDERFPWINGYKPLGNYQGLLAEVVVGRLDEYRHLDELADAIVRAEAPIPDPRRIRFEPAPKPEHPGLYLRDSTGGRERQYRARKIDYFEREARNRSLGTAGEEVVLELERHRLIAEGKRKLAEEVEWVSRTRGDGLGFDVLSFENSGEERFIEVKTTNFGKETPFYVSRNELSFSRDFAPQFQLYRLFGFRESPRLYALQGPIEESCRLEATTFAANVR
jgi:hypothetical protein